MNEYMSNAAKEYMANHEETERRIVEDLGDFFYFVHDDEEALEVLRDDEVNLALEIADDIQMALEALRAGYAKAEKIANASYKSRRRYR